jgi:small subunit ribosomal protein S16
MVSTEVANVLKRRRGKFQSRSVRTQGLTGYGAAGVLLNFSIEESLRKTSVMALKIRLTKVGSVHQPLYRVVVAEARSRRDGDAVENLGTYTPKTKGNPINIKLDRVDYWLSKGALPTNTMHSMIKKARRAAAATAPAA